MSTRRRREAPLPASAAGLLRFFEEETRGIKVSPLYVIIGTIVFITLSLLIRLFI